MDIHRKMQDIQNTHSAQIREIKKKQQAEMSHAALANQINKRFTTAIIGALDVVEKNLGSKWGKDKPISSCSPEELELREIWGTIRKSILDHGNNQKRLTLDELGSYSVRWERSTKTIPISERKI